MNPRLVALVFVVFLVTTSFTQDKPEGKSVDAPVSIVTNLMVTDSNGNPVNDVKKDEVRIFEDGIEQHISYFARRDPVLHMGFVIDNTGSMREQMERVINISNLVTSSLREKDEAFILRFVSRDKITLQQDWTSDKGRLTKSFDSMFIEGGATAVVDGLYLAEDKLSSKAKEPSVGRYALVLISDCVDRDSYYNTKQLIARLRPTDIQVFVVALTSQLSDARPAFKPAYTSEKQKAESFANILALKTGGAVLIPSGEENRKKPLADLIKPIISELQANYVIGYTSSDSRWDGRTRSLRIQIADGPKDTKRQGITRESFTVPKTSN